MTRHYRWDTTLGERRRDDPGIDNPARRAAARETPHARDVGYHLAQMRKQRGLTQAEVARAMNVSQAHVSRMEQRDVEKMQVESIAAYVTAIGPDLLRGQWLWVRSRRRGPGWLDVRGGSCVAG